jgi:organic hydroperoxide reductase OsmC/OhrA
MIGDATEARRTMEHTATIEWSRGEAAFVDQKYPRAHRWRFDGGAVVAGSSSPHVVPEPQSDATAVDPEEAFVAALASCHMLWFLSIAATRGFVVDAYADDATGTMARVAKGRLAITEVVLRPRVRFHGAAPDAATHEAMHHEAHDACFIANSVKSDVRVVPTLA